MHRFSSPVAAARCACVLLCTYVRVCVDVVCGQARTSMRMGVMCGCARVRVRTRRGVSVGWVYTCVCVSCAYVRACDVRVCVCACAGGCGLGDKGGRERGGAKGCKHVQ